ncbi:MAG: type III-B CRISPR module-associated protein Cmr5 [Pseudomonadota bacterium]|nr:type III-B CRISPR module-associated protein Cmr5 [Pseudomonadota bacterium]
MSQTLDQQRAAFAWDCASAGMQQHGKEYKVLAKGAPALIMNSGLMPTLAFYNHKGKAAAQILDDLIRGLSLRLAGQKLNPGQGAQLFGQFMVAMQKAESQDYLRNTDEALEILKWIRQFVDAVDA